MFDEISLHEEMEADVNCFNQVYLLLHEDRTNQFYDSNSYNNLISRYDDTKFSLFHLNIRSVRANGDALMCYL